MVLSQEQRDKRRLGIGSSDVACILGADQWKSDYELWLEKTGRAVMPEAGQAAEIGNQLESYVLSLVEQELLMPVLENPGTDEFTYTNGVLRANVDGMIGKFEKGSPIVEIKTTGLTQDWGSPMTDEIPFRVLCQVTHQMIACDSDLCYVGCLKAERGFKFDIYKVQKDPDFANELKQKCEDWWKTHVVLDTAPPITRAVDDDVWSGVERIPLKSCSVSTELLQSYIEAREKAKAAEQEMKEAKSSILAAMGDAEIAVSPGFACSFKKQNRKSFDTSEFKKGHPELFQAFQKTSTFRRFDVRELKQ